MFPRQVATADTAVALTDDSYTKSTMPVANFGAKTTLLVQGPPANAVVENSYVRFDLSTLPPGTVGSDVAKATLTLGVHKVTSAGAFDVFRVTSPWSEEGITAGSAPTLGGTPEASAVALALTDQNTFKASMSPLSSRTGWTTSCRTMASRWYRT